MLRRARWWLADYVYAGYWQLRGFFDRTAAADFAEGSRAPILILPGVYESWRFMRPLISVLHERGHPVHVVPALGYHRRPIAESAATAANVLEELDLERVIIVAHSKGGLSGKAVMLSRSGARVHGMVAVATPFAGSAYARLLLLPTLRAFSPSHPSIIKMAGQRDVNARIVSVYPAFDPHIPEGSELPGAKNVRLATGGHFRVLAHARVIAEVVTMAEGDDPRSS